MLKITTASFSGGQGKTTCTLFLGKKLAEKGYRVLLVDADPQANLTFYANHHVSEDEPTLLEVIKAEVSPLAAVYPTPTPNLQIVPADRALGSAQDYLASSGKGMMMLRKRLEPLEKHFDVALIDSPPQGFQLSLSALGCCDLLLISVEAHSKGVDSLINTLAAVAESREFNMFPGSVLGVIPFRDKWVGNSQTKTSASAIAAMKAIAEEQDIRLWPSILESDAFRKALDTGKVPSDFNPQITHALDLIVSELQEKWLSKKSLTPSIA